MAAPEANDDTNQFHIIQPVCGGGGCNGGCNGGGGDCNGGGGGCIAGGCNGDGDYCSGGGDWSGIIKVKTRE